MSNLPPPPPPPPGGRGQQQQQGPQRPDQNGRRPLGSGWPRWMIPVLLAAVVLFVAVPRVWPSGSGDKLTYTEFMSRVNAGDVKSITIDKGTGTITGTTVDGDEFTATGAGDRGVSAADEATLDEKNVNIKFTQPSSNWLLNWAGLLLPIVLIIGFFVWMQRRAAGQMGNVMSIGRSRAKAYQADKPSTTFSDIAGYEGVKQEITEVVDFLRMPER